jgi:hypothetical protein
MTAAIVVEVMTAAVAVGTTIAEAAIEGIAVATIRAEADAMMVGHGRAERAEDQIAVTAAPDKSDAARTVMAARTAEIAPPPIVRPKA